jgi:hypothetical protein
VIRVIFLLSFNKDIIITYINYSQLNGRPSGKKHQNDNEKINPLS